MSFCLLQNNNDYVTRYFYSSTYTEFLTDSISSHVTFTKIDPIIRQNDPHNGSFGVYINYDAQSKKEYITKINYSFSGEVYQQRTLLPKLSSERLIPILKKILYLLLLDPDL